MSSILGVVCENVCGSLSVVGLMLFTLEEACCTAETSDIYFFFPVAEEQLNEAQQSGPTCDVAFAPTVLQRQVGPPSCSVWSTY